MSAPMLVSDLKTSLEGRREENREVVLGDIEIADDSSVIKIKNGPEFPFDEQAERTLTKYLGINKSYISKCPPDLRAYNINWWLQNKPEAPSIIQSLGDHFITIHKPNVLIVPITKVGEIIDRTFKPTDEIVNFIHDNTTFHIDIRTDHHVEVPVDERIEGRKEVGDITHGGVRILANPTQVKPPQVLTYLHRLVCTNGMCSDTNTGVIQLKGNTVETLLAELEAAANRVMGDLDRKLADYAALAERRPPGSPARFAYQVGREYGLGQRLMDRVMERINILPDDATLYDITQVFTQLANGNVNYKTMSALQHLGGDMAFHTDHVVHRCEACERLLPED